MCIEAQRNQTFQIVKLLILDLAQLTRLPLGHFLQSSKLVHLA